jgi:hypothetical protein
MKLSTAILNGAGKRPQATTGDYFAEVEGGGVCSCALGAAFEAAFGEVWVEKAREGTGYVIGMMLDDAFPVLDAVASCPVGGCRWTTSNPVLGRVISHLNDDHAWPREQIADYVRGFEEEG